MPKKKSKKKRKKTIAQEILEAFTKFADALARRVNGKKPCRRPKHRKGKR